MFPVVPKLAINIALATSLSGKYIERISSKSLFVTPIDSNLVTIVDKKPCDHVMPISTDSSEVVHRYFAEKISWPITRKTTLTRKKTLPPMNKSIVQVKISYRGIRLVRSHENLVLKLVTLVLQVRVVTAPEILFFIKVGKLTSSCATLPKGMKFASCILSPQSWYESRFIKKILYDQCHTKVFSSSIE